MNLDRTPPRPGAIQQAGGFLLAVVLILGMTWVLNSPALAQQTPAAQPVGKPNEKKIPFEVHGFLLGALSGRTTGERPPGGEGGDFVLGEERLRLEVSGATQSGNALFLAKGDLFHDAVANRFDVELREAYAGYSRGSLEFRLGRQILTWGVGDLFFINDFFPKDWESFFSGRPMEYLKLGVDGIRTRYSSGAVNAEFLAVPFFTPDRPPSAERFFLFDPFSGVPTQRETKPASRYSNTELALRLYRQVADFDVSLYAYRGFWRAPSVRLDSPAAPTTATRFYPEISVYGASAQRNLFEGVCSLETGYYDSRQDRSGADPNVPNSQWRFLAGYQRQMGQDLTAGLQWYGELMNNYGAYRGSLPAASPRQDQFRGVVSTRLTQWLAYQTWRLSLFAAYSPTDEDYFLQPEISHKVSDHLSLSLGSNIFGGRRETTFFGQFEKSDNVFVNVRFDF
ncbi:MAG: hypothetical protein HY652_01640 [Acidobacteria bacterium]|nr:hypothetical protein [Acidobacteriota bacterium]